MKRELYCFNISKELYLKVKDISEKTGESLYTIVSNAISEYLANNYKEILNQYTVICMDGRETVIGINVKSASPTHAKHIAKQELERKAYNTNDFIFKIKR